jgi:23S rRNA A2030 N6-methylase RlmJ
MKYSHKEHAGSVADIWKHEQLTTVVARVAENVDGIFTYHDTHCAYDVYEVDGETHVGSWRSVDCMLLRRKNPYRIVVSDTDADVFDDIKDTPGIEVHHKDGFKLAQSMLADFTFIDPTYVEDSDWSHVAYTCSMLSICNKHFMAWYPLMDDFKNNNFPDTLKRLEIYWGGSRRLKGCGLLVDDETFKILTK